MGGTSNILEWFAGIGGAVLALLMLVLIVIARRGRRIDDHPVCRKCGFDQTGRPQSSTRCAECGVDLTRPRALRIGNRQRNVPLVRCGIVGLLVGLFLVGWVGVRVVSRIDFIQWMPLSWVLDETESASPGTRQRAHNELMRRINVSALSKAQQAHLVAWMLRIHGDPKAAWTGWEPVLDLCLSSGVMNNQQIEQLLRQWLDPQLQIKPALRRGQAITLDLRVGSDRGSSRIRISGGWECGPLIVGGVELAQQIASNQTNPPDETLHTSSHVTSIAPRWQALAELPDGSHVLSVNLRSDIAVKAPIGAGVFKIDIPIKKTITLAAKDATLDNFVVDDAQRQAITDAVKQAHIGTDEGTVLLGINVGNPPVPLAMEAFLVRGDQRQRIGTLRIAAGTKPGWKQVHTNAKPRFLDGNVDVVLIPAQAGADRTYSIDTYWGEQIVIRDVPVNKPYTPPYNDDESLRPAVEACVKLDKVIVVADRKNVSMNISFRSAPVKLAYRVFVRAGEEERRMQSVQIGVAAGGNSSYGFSDTWPGPFPDVSTVDVTLRPDNQWELQTTDQVPPWSGEITLKSIPIERK